MSLIYCYLIWSLFCILEGARDGVTYHIRDHATKLNFNEHIIYLPIRAMFSLLLSYLGTWWLMVPFFLSLSFFHNGMYYTTRDLLKPGTYGLWWFDQSTTSTAWSTKYNTPLVRTVLFICSLLIMIPILCNQNT